MNGNLKDLEEMLTDISMRIYDGILKDARERSKGINHIHFYGSEWEISFFVSSRIFENLQQIRGFENLEVSYGKKSSRNGAYNIDLGALLRIYDRARNEGKQPIL